MYQHLQIQKYLVFTFILMKLLIDTTLDCFLMMYTFIDLQKAYDTINREALWAVLERYSLPPKIIALIKAMHASSSACVRAFGDVSGSFEIHNGVRQGCILSPTLFIIFLDFVLRQMPTERKAGIQIAYRFHNNLINT